MAAAVRRLVGRTRTVETPYTDEEMIERLRTVPRPFAVDLLRRHARYGRLSHEQIVAGHMMVLENTSPVPAVDYGDFSSIQLMFETAAKTLRFPQVHFGFDDNPIHLSLAGARSDNAGAVRITRGLGHGSPNNHLGVIINGKLEPHWKCPQDVIEFLQFMAQDPAAAVSAYGREQGRCCFCRQRINDKRSVRVGYGPTCAKNYGLLDQWHQAAGGTATDDEFKADTAPDSAPLFAAIIGDESLPVP